MQAYISISVPIKQYNLNKYHTHTYFFLARPYLLYILYKYLPCPCLLTFLINSKVATTHVMKVHVVHNIPVHSVQSRPVTRVLFAILAETSQLSKCSCQIVIICHMSLVLVYVPADKYNLSYVPSSVVQVCSVSLDMQYSLYP